MFGIGLQKGSRETKFLLAVFICFMLLRLFTSDGYYFVSGDNAKYLSLAKNLPQYTAYNAYAWVKHPPLYPVAVRAFSFALPDYTAGILVSFAASAISFFVVLKILSLFGAGFYERLIAVFPLVTAMLYTLLSREIMKESLFFMLFALCIYFYAKAVKENRRSDFVYAGVFAGASALTLDLGLVFGIAFIAGVFLFREKKNLVNLLIPIALLAMLYAPWLGYRYAVYTGNEYYPAGIDGTIEKVSDFSVMQLISPTQFSESAYLADYYIDLNPLRIAKKAATVFTSPFRTIPEQGSFFYFMALFFTGFLGIAGAYVSFRKRLRSISAWDWFFLVLLLVSMAPLLSAGATSRFAITELVPICYFVLRGVSLFKHRAYEIALMLTAMMLMFTAFFIASNQHLAFAAQKEVKLQNLAAYLDTLPGGTVMAEFSYPPALGYLTSKTILGLPTSIGNLDLFVGLYNVDYVVFGDHRNERYDSVIGYIKTNPQKFEFLVSVTDEYRSEAARYVYGDFSAEDTTFVYRVVR